MATTIHQLLQPLPIKNFQCTTDNGYIISKKCHEKCDIVNDLLNIITTYPIVQIEIEIQDYDKILTVVFIRLQGDWYAQNSTRLMNVEHSNEPCENIIHNPRVKIANLMLNTAKICKALRINKI